MGKPSLGDPTKFGGWGTTFFSSLHHLAPGANTLAGFLVAFLPPPRHQVLPTNLCPLSSSKTYILDNLYVHQWGLDDRNLVLHIYFVEYARAPEMLMEIVAMENSGKID